MACAGRRTQRTLVKAAAQPATLAVPIPSQGSLGATLWYPSNVPSAVGDGRFACVVSPTVVVPTGTTLDFCVYDPREGRPTEANSDTCMHFTVVLTNPLAPKASLALEIANNVVLPQPGGTPVVGTTAKLVAVAGGGDVSTTATVLYNYQPDTMEFASLTVVGYGTTSTGCGGELSPAPAGAPLFAVGFRYVAGTDVPVDYADTGAPNFPDQYAPASAVATHYNFQFETIFPTAFEGAAAPGWAFTTNGAGGSPVPAVGSSWCSARAQMSNPAVSTSWTDGRWSPVAASGVTLLTPGPFDLLPSPGQLACVYFRPKPRDPSASVPSTPLDPPGTADVAFLVTLDLAPGARISFTHQPFDESSLMVVDVDAGTPVAPAFTWTVGSSGVKAGTVVMLVNIGSSDAGILVTDGATGVSGTLGFVDNQVSSDEAIVSLIAALPWTEGVAGMVPITATLTAQYSGFTPPNLTPGLTYNAQRAPGIAVYLPNVKTTTGPLPFTAFGALVNSSPHTLVFFPLTYDQLPVFAGCETINPACAPFSPEAFF
jgi:hypothetical protein